MATRELTVIWLGPISTMAETNTSPVLDSVIRWGYKDQWRIKNSTEETLYQDPFWWGLWPFCRLAQKPLVM